MFDINIIREKYASMTDEQLLYLVKDDSQDLTDEALAILKQEFAKRNLDISVFTPVERDQTNEEEREPIPGFYNPASGADDAILGRNYLHIKNPSEEKERAENEKKFAANLTTEEIQKLVDKCDKSMLINGIIFIIGIAVTVVTYINVAERGGSYVVAWGAIVFGAFSFFKALD